ECGVGADILNGGPGSDAASYEHSSDGVTVSLLDHTAAGGDAQGDTLDSIENLTGSNSADTLSGDNGDNWLMGLDGDNTLNGHGGDDTLVGGNDNDTMYGMDGVDTLKGYGGNDTLDGGAGADFLYGGYGDDTYFVDNGGDVVSEGIGQGFDQVKTSGSYNLFPGSEVEVLETTDPAGTSVLNLNGNDLDNTIIGNNGQNSITSRIQLTILS